VNLFRRASAPPQDDEEDLSVADGADQLEYEPGADQLEYEPEDEPGVVADTETDEPATPSPQGERQQKAAQKSSRMELVRQARKASSAMQDPEPQRAWMVSAFLVAVGLLSYFSKDVEQVSQKVHGKTHLVSETVVHPSTAALLVIVALVAAATTYWRKRYVTGIAFMIAAAVGIGAPLPSGLSDVMWLTFLVPAGYVLWLLMFRMNKEQKAWLAAHGASAQNNGGSSSARSTSSGSSSRQKSSSQRGQQSTSAARSRKKDQPAISATGRPLPQNSGRYTRPQSKPKASQRRS
jgi:hypothetical protein